MAVYLKTGLYAFHPEHKMREVQGLGQSVLHVHCSKVLLGGLPIEHGCSDALPPLAQVCPLADRLVRMGHVWDAIKGSNIRFAIDANRGWTARDAIHISNICSDIPFIIEQPCNTNDELRQLRPLLRHPLYMDESSFDVNTVINAVGSGLVDGFGLKLTRLGGLQPMTTVRDICAARNLPHTCDEWGGDILAAACTHLGATVRPDLLEGVWLAAPYIDGHYCPEVCLEAVGGHINLPKGPGLGIIPDEAAFGPPVVEF